MDRTRFVLKIRFDSGSALEFNTLCPMAELADAQRSGRCMGNRTGSNPVWGIGETARLASRFLLVWTKVKIPARGIIGIIYLVDAL